MDLSNYEENYKGPVVVEVVKARVGKTPNTGSEYLELGLKVESAADGYNMEEFMDPAGYTLRDTIWTPMNSDETSKKRNKGIVTRRVCVAFGFDGTELPEAEAFIGLSAICEIQPNRESGEIEVKYKSYKAQ